MNLNRGKSALLISACLCVTGCSSNSFHNPLNVQITGKMMGGQQPIGGATLQLYAVNTTTLGGASTAMLGTVTTSDGSGLLNSNANAGNVNNTLPIGFFNITGLYSCSSLPNPNTPVYLTGVGGNPGLAANTNNTAATEMAALGPCSQLTSSTFISMNEATTVGSIAALYPYMTSLSAVGSTSANASWLAAEFSQANVYMNLGSGTTPGPALPAGYYASSKEANTLADVLAACVNTTGGSAPNGVSDGSICGNLFAAAAPSNTSVPTEVSGATNYILNNPTNNVATIYSYMTATPPFLPNLTSAPSTWALPIVPYPQAPTASPGAGTYARAQSVTLSTVTPNATIYYTLDGSTPKTSSSVYSGPITENGGTLKAIAVTRAGTSASSSIAYTVTGSVPAPVISLASGTYSSPQLLSVTDTAADASIYVTVDGTTPTASSTLLTSTLLVATSETLRAIAISGNLQSPVSSATYLYSPNSQIINTLAGGGTNGDGVTATGAELYNPYGVAVDLAGNIYIADGTNNRIRKVAPDTGIITTVAGGGTSPSTCSGSTDTVGDGCVATSATFNQPYSVAVDSSGNLYISDAYNYRIRKVTAATGIITTVAGTGTSGFTGDGALATAAQIRSPYGLAVDSSGNIYFADYANLRIREVMADTGIISTVAGGGTNPTTCAGSTDTVGDGCLSTSATLSYPTSVGIDSGGNVYICDSSNNRVRKVTAGTGIIATVAGTGTSGFAGDGGSATLAKLNYPKGLTIDPSGNVYISDNSNQRIREVTVATGNITTITGNGTGAFSGDGGAAVNAQVYYPFGLTTDSGGNLYIADVTNSRIRKVTTATGVITTVAGNGTPGYVAVGDGGAASTAALYHPYNVALDGKGNVYIADAGNNRIRKVTAGTGVITTVAGGGSSPSTCSGSTNTLGDGCLATSAGLSSPDGVMVDSSGNLYIADTNNNRIREVAVATGIITTVAGGGTAPTTCAGNTNANAVGDGCTATNAKLTSPRNMTLDGSGNLFIADTSDQRIREVVASTGLITTVAGTGTASYTGDGGQAINATLSTPYSVLVDSSGNLYIGDYANNRIREVAVNGIITTIVGGGSSPTTCTGSTDAAGDGCTATNAALSRPSGMSFDSSGNLYFADYFNSLIRKYSPTTGLVTRVAGNLTAGYTGDGGSATSAEINYPYGVAVDSSGNMYIADYGNNRIRIVSH